MDRRLSSGAARGKLSDTKRKKEYRTQRKIHRLLTGLLVIILTGGGGYELMRLVSDTFGGPMMEVLEHTDASGQMQVTFLDVGQGDCTIVQAEGHAMVIDAGNNSQGKRVTSWLTEQGITELDYLILTHPDADHIGGADDVLRAVSVNQVIMPDVANDTKTYGEVMELLEERQILIDFPEVGRQYTLGDAGFTILCPQPEDISEEDLNGSSVGMKLVHGRTSFILCGDAETEAERNMVSLFGDGLEADVLKCGHHGSSTATSGFFLHKVDPIWAVISCGKDNSYGHPHAEVLAALQDADVQVYRTDELGTITAVSDGEQITWEQGE